MALMKASQEQQKDIKYLGKASFLQYVVKKTELIRVFHPKELFKEIHILDEGENMLLILKSPNLSEYLDEVAQVYTRLYTSMIQYIGLSKFGDMDSPCTLMADRIYVKKHPGGNIIHIPLSE